MLLGRCWERGLFVRRYGEGGRSGRRLVGLWLVRSTGWALVGCGLLSLLYMVFSPLCIKWLWACCCSCVRVFLLCVRVLLGVFGRSADLAAIGTLSAISPRVAVRMPLRSLSRIRCTNGYPFVGRLRAVRIPIVVRISFYLFYPSGIYSNK